MTASLGGVVIEILVSYIYFWNLDILLTPWLVAYPTSLVLPTEGAVIIFGMAGVAALLIILLLRR